MKAIIEEIDSRIKSPLFGYFSFLLLAFNWEEIFYLTADNSSVTDRIIHFHNGTDVYSLFFYPFIFSVIYAVIYPWLNYFIMHFIAKPTELRNTLQAQSEHKLIIKKQELEDARTKLLSSAEKELIDRAKRDAELNSIEDEEVREKLKSEIEELRKERDEFRTDSTEKSESGKDSIGNDKLKILRLITRDGGEMPEHNIIDASSFDKVKTEYYLEDLNNTGYLSKDYAPAPVSDHVYSLTTASKKIMVDHGFAK